MAQTEGQKRNDWITTGAYILGIGIVAFLVFQVVGSFSSILNSLGNAGSAAANTGATAVQSGASFVDDIFTTLGFNQFNPSTIPGYKPGNWQLLMSQSNNPFTPSYQPAASSSTNPGPTAVMNNYSLPIYNALYHYYTPVDINTLIGTFNTIPSRDVFNLTWSYLQKGIAVPGVNFDLVTDPNYGIDTLSQTVQDTLASIILNKPITA